MKLNEIKLTTKDGHRIQISDTLYSNYSKEGFGVTTEWYVEHSGKGDAVLTDIFKDKNRISPKLKK